MQYALDVVCSMSVMVSLYVVCHVDTSLQLHFTMWIKFFQQRIILPIQLFEEKMWENGMVEHRFIDGMGRTGKSWYACLSTN